MRTSNLNQNISSSENIEIPLFKKLKDVTYEEHLDPFIDQSEIYCSIPENTVDIGKRYILDDVTGHLREDTELSEVNLNNDNYYLVEETGLLKP